jgi:hypothetical protein
MNWTMTASGTFDALAVNPENPRHLAALRNETLSVSRDGGMTFDPLNLS